MSVDGAGRGVGLIGRMQPGGNLENSWIMFDHVKCITNWTMMACHVYDLTYCKVMTIIICDMQIVQRHQSTTVHVYKVQLQMFKHEYLEPNFKRFMVDIAQEN
jgi:hypothetical protein